MQTALSEYEKARLNQIEQNNAHLNSLGLSATREALNTLKKNRKSNTKRKRSKLIPNVRPRRSSRIRQIRPQYTGERIDNSMDQKDNDDLKQKKRKKKSWAKMSDDEVIANTINWVKKHQLELLSSYPLKASTKNNEFYKIAEKKWGNLVSLAQNTCTDWELYVLSRTSKWNRDGIRYGLLQEDYSHCPWRLLIACVLMSRVSSVSVKTRCINDFFEKYPTPSAVLDNSFNPASAYEILRPLGLFENRLRSCVEISKKFLQMATFDVGLTPYLKIYGVGEFGCNSFTIFIRDGAEDLYPKDKNLARYCNWKRNNL